MQTHNTVHQFNGKDHKATVESEPIIKGMRTLLPMTTINRVNKHITTYKTGLDRLKAKQLKASRVITKPAKRIKKDKFIYLPDENGVDLIKVKML